MLIIEKVFSNDCVNCNFNVFLNKTKQKKREKVQNFQCGFSLLYPLYFSRHINCILSVFEKHIATIKTLFSIETQLGMLIISRYITEEENERINQ